MFVIQQCSRADAGPQGPPRARPPGDAADPNDHQHRRGMPSQATRPQIRTQRPSDQTPNGRRLSWAFHEPVVTLAAQGSYLLRLVPARVLGMLFADWPPQQLSVLRALLRSPHTIRAALSMAHDEMRTIAAPDLDTLRTHQARLRFYFCEPDSWVGAEREVVLRSFEDVAAVKVVHGAAGIPHAFCISAYVGHALTAATDHLFQTTARRSRRHASNGWSSRSRVQPTFLLYIHCSITIR
jgi:hypothetical protein